LQHKQGTSNVNVVAMIVGGESIQDAAGIACIDHVSFWYYINIKLLGNLFFVC